MATIKVNIQISVGELMPNGCTSLNLEDLKAKSETALDGFIRDDIIKINEAGLKTVWSCSGITEDHSWLVEAINNEPGLLIRSKKAEVSRIYLSAYLSFAPDRRLPRVHGWNRRSLTLIGGPVTSYEIDDNFPHSYDWKENDKNLKVLWVRLFDFLNQAIEG